MYTYLTLELRHHIADAPVLFACIQSVSEIKTARFKEPFGTIIVAITVQNRKPLSQNYKKEYQFVLHAVKQILSICDIDYWS